LEPEAAGSPLDISAFGDPTAIVLRTRRSTSAVSLTSGRPNLVWRFIIPAVAAAANYGHKTKIQSSKTTSTRT
jgi:hypothetical protein